MTIRSRFTPAENYRPHRIVSDKGEFIDFFDTELEAIAFLEECDLEVVAQDKNADGVTIIIVKEEK